MHFLSVWYLGGALFCFFRLFLGDSGSMFVVFFVNSFFGVILVIIVLLQ